MKWEQLERMYPYTQEFTKKFLQILNALNAEKICF